MSLLGKLLVPAVVVLGAGLTVTHADAAPPPTGAAGTLAARQLERLDRGLISVRSGSVSGGTE